MQSPARDLVDHTQRRRFGDAFSGGAGLTDSGRSFLLKKLGDEDDAGGGDDLLSLAELGDMSDPKRRQEVRAWFESAFALGWDRAVLRPRELGDLAPAARLVPDVALAAKPQSTGTSGTGASGAFPLVGASRSQRRSPARDTRPWPDDRRLSAGRLL